MKGTEPFVICAVHVLLVACTSPSNHGADKEPPRSHFDQPPRSHFDPKAVQEVEHLGYRKYENTALITEETPDVPPALSEARAKVTFDPASGPVCMNGSAYSVWYADRHSEDLILLLDGGGACWSSMCRTTTSVEPQIQGIDVGLAFPNGPRPTEPPPNYPGVISSELPPPEQDFRDWNAVSIPYCDGSVFMGDGDGPPAPNTDLRLHHGQQNLAAALDVAVTHFPNPKRVLLLGWSAGGYGTITGMIATRLRYPDAELYVLNDSGPGVFNLDEMTDMDERLVEWNYARLLPDSCTKCAGGQLAPLFDWMLERDDDIRIGVASNRQDATISSFLRISPEDYEPLLREALAPASEAHPDRFKRFTVPGQDHVLVNGWDISVGRGYINMAAGVHFDTWTVAMTNRDDATWVDIQADCVYACCHEDQSSCEAEPGCTAFFGRHAPDDPDTFAGCAPTPSKCDDQVVCGIIGRPGPMGEPDVECRQFPTTCVPNGWEADVCDDRVATECHL